MGEAAEYEREQEWDKQIERIAHERKMCQYPCLYCEMEEELQKEVS